MDGLKLNQTEKEKISKFITPITRLAALKCTIIIQ